MHYIVKCFASNKYYQKIYHISHCKILLRAPHLYEQQTIAAIMKVILHVFQEMVLSARRFEQRQVRRQVQGRAGSQ